MLEKRKKEWYERSPYWALIPATANTLGLYALAILGHWWPIAYLVILAWLARNTRAYLIAKKRYDEFVNREPVFGDNAKYKRYCHLQYSCYYRRLILTSNASCGVGTILSTLYLTFGLRGLLFGLALCALCLILSQFFQKRA